MGGSAVTKIGNTGRGTDGTGGGEQRQGVRFGAYGILFLRDSQAEIQSGHLVLAGVGLGHGCVIRHSALC